MAISEGINLLHQNRRQSLMYKDSPRAERVKALHHVILPEILFPTD